MEAEGSSAKDSDRSDDNPCIDEGPVSDAHASSNHSVRIEERLRQY